MLSGSLKKKVIAVDIWNCVQLSLVIHSFELARFENIREGQRMFWIVPIIVCY